MYEDQLPTPSSVTKDSLWDKVNAKYQSLVSALKTDLIELTHSFNPYKARTVWLPELAALVTPETPSDERTYRQFIATGIVTSKYAGVWEVLKVQLDLITGYDCLLTYDQVTLDDFVDELAGVYEDELLGTYGTPVTSDDPGTVFIDIGVGRTATEIAKAKIATAGYAYFTVFVGYESGSLFIKY